MALHFRGGTLTQTHGVIAAQRSSQAIFTVPFRWSSRFHSALLQENCFGRVARNCGHPLGWAIAKGNSVCDVCEACLRPRAHETAETIGDHIRDDCIDAAALISGDARVRNLVLAKLPPPFHAWEAGDVFAAIVELGVTSEDDLTPETGKELSRRMARGDFSQFLPKHLAWGYRFLRGWPDTINEHFVRIRPKTMTLVSDPTSLWQNSLVILRQALLFGICSGRTHWKVNTAPVLQAILLLFKRHPQVTQPNWLAALRFARKLFAGSGGGGARSCLKERTRAARHYMT